MFAAPDVATSSAAEWRLYKQEWKYSYLHNLSRLRQNAVQLLAAQRRMSAEYLAALTSASVENKTAFLRSVIWTIPALTDERAEIKLKIRRLQLERKKAKHRVKVNRMITRVSAANLKRQQSRNKS